MGCHTRNMFKTIACDCDLHVLADSIVQAGLKEAIATTPNITVFGPKNKALCKFLQANPGADLASVLTYHVLPESLKAKDLVNDQKYVTLSGDSVRANQYSCPTFNKVTTVNGVPLSEKNIHASNGILHKIGKVLVPPTGTVAQIVTENPDFSILLQAVLAADPAVLALLSDPNANLTVFAPTNQAFESLASELGLSLAEILALPNLTNILLYHVLSLSLGTVFSAAIREGKTKNVPTLAEQDITFCRCGKKIYIKDANDRKSKVIGADVLVTNGVVHVIDKVLLPL